eukprot:GDKI01017526.1.p1 GENE.GDKI01017526.1~~GDKI01017526.1.p1  ORF type:complete len:181 (+),score=38.82 GDKI01017526.1:181-723(+)
MSAIGRFRLRVAAAQAKPAPAIGQALGPLGINMMAFCKEFNARTQKIRADVPIQVTLVPHTDRTYKFALRSPGSWWFIRRAARIPQGSSNPGTKVVGNITYKEVYHIAKAKSMDPQWIGLPLYCICKSIISTCRAIGVVVTKELLPEFSKRDNLPVTILDDLKKDLRAKNKAAKRGAKGK